MKALKKILSMMIAATLILTAAVPATAETSAEVQDTDVPVMTPAEMVEGSEYANDEIIVVFDDSVRDRKIETTLETENAECVEITEVSDETKMAVAEIDGDVTVEEAIMAMTDNNNILYAQPNYKYKMAADMGTNDPYNNDYGLNQWYLSNIKARDAWEFMKKSGVSMKPVTVAVIDSGADIKHEDLAANLSADSARIMGHKVQKLTGDSDNTGHGTHVSGIIGAVADNAKGIAGVASGAGNKMIKIMAIDASSQDDPGEYFDTYGVVSAINYAVEKGAKVINMSLGGFGHDLVMEEAVENAYAAGTTIVAAAGNEGSDKYVSPGDNNEVICVCSTTREDRRYEYDDGWDVYSSNYGQAKDLSAPGAAILSTIPGGYENMTGTSMASPVVSAVAAMIYMVKPDITPAQVKNILCGTARDINAAGFDYYTGYGVVNALDAVKAAINAGTSEKISKICFKESEKYIHHINDGASEMLEITTYPVSSLEKVTWNSSDESVVTVDEYGKIRGVSTGKAVITCKSSKASAEITVQVDSLNKPEKVLVTNRESVEFMKVGQMVYLKTEVLPRYADDKNIYWKSSNQSVVTVDELGYVTARGLGEAYIIGYTYNAPCKDTSKDALAVADDRTVIIKVKVGKTVDSVKLTAYKSKIKMGTTYTFKAAASPSDAAEKTVMWKSSNRGIAKINAKTGKLTPVAPGKTTITAYTANGKSDSVRVTIYKTDYKQSDYNLTAQSTGAYSIKLKWKAIPDADGYKIYRNGKLYRKVGANVLSFKNTKLYCGVTYKYSVRAYYGADNCSASAVKSVKPVPGTPKISAKNSKGKITVSWTKVPSATKYVLYKYSKAKGKYIAVKTLKGRTYTDKNVTKGKIYSYKVRAFRNTEKAGKVWSKYSNVTKLTCK